jgi:hypothetical protein
MILQKILVQAGTSWLWLVDIHIGKIREGIMVLVINKIYLSFIFLVRIFKHMLEPTVLS